MKLKTWLYSAAVLLGILWACTADKPTAPEAVVVQPAVPVEQDVAPVVVTAPQAVEDPNFVGTWNGCVLTIEAKRGRDFRVQIFTHNGSIWNQSSVHDEMTHVTPGTNKIDFCWVKDKWPGCRLQIDIGNLLTYHWVHGGSCQPPCEGEECEPTPRPSPSPSPSPSPTPPEPTPTPPEPTPTPPEPTPTPPGCECEFERHQDFCKDNPSFRSLTPNPFRSLTGGRECHDLLGLDFLSKDDFQTHTASRSAVAAIVKAGQCYSFFYNVKAGDHIDSHSKHDVSHVTYCECDDDDCEDDD